MVQQAFSKDTNNNLFNQVKVGMHVHDSQDRHIGKVEDVYFGASSPSANAQGTGSATAPDQIDPGNDFVQQVVRGFGNDNVPEELRQRLLREGYIRIGGEGLLGTARYILPEQVQRVSGDHVMLRVNKDELIKR